MRFVRKLAHGIRLAVAAVTVLAATGSADAGFVFPSFGSPDVAPPGTLRLNGAAAVVPPVLRVVRNEGSLAGSAFHVVPQVVANGFETTFRFRIFDGNELPNRGGDGLAFVLQNAAAGTAAIGNGGGGLGYTGIPNSLAVEFDTFNNLTPDEPNSNHIAVYSGGTGPNDSLNAAFQLGVNGNLASQLRQDTPHTARLLYNPGNLQVFLDGAPVLNLNVNLSTLLNLGPGGTAFVGFTAGTGGQTDNHDILSWTFVQPQAVPEPATAVLAGLGGLILAAARRRRAG